MRTNVLIYNGPGASLESVKNTLYSLRRLLSPHYAVFTADPHIIIHEPWISSTALLVVPGGADIPYCKMLNGAGNRMISRYVSQGGRYLGLCAGAYYAASYIEFELNSSVDGMAVEGDRELSFFPGVARGTAFSGFKYNSEQGSRAARLKVEWSSGFGLKEPPASLSQLQDPDYMRIYYNGGPVFVDANYDSADGVTVLARYTEPLSVNGGPGNAAIVKCKVGTGSAILCGPHPEFSISCLEPHNSQIKDQLTDNEPRRAILLKQILLSLGLEVNSCEEPVPNLTNLYLSSLYPSGVSDILQGVSDMLVRDDKQPGERLIVGENDTFRLVTDDAPLSVLASHHTPVTPDEDLNKVIKTIILCPERPPNVQETPYFNHGEYYQLLEAARGNCNYAVNKFGSHIMYGEVVTSTSTMLDKNFAMLRRLPPGFTAVGTVQIAGRGRGSNVWVSPMGVLAFSSVIRHPVSHAPGATVVLVQYLVSLAVANAISSYGSGYDKIPIRLKWPNDLYADVSTSDDPDRYVKIGGILVNTNIDQSDYILVIGCGINVTNQSPTTSLKSLIDRLNASTGNSVLEYISHEALLAKIQATFDDMYSTFKYQGFAPFEQAYYKYWLHTNQTVRLETHSNARAKIKGITLDYGLLRARAIDSNGNETGQEYQLQPDGNSFDMMRGLLKKKIP